MLWIMVERGYKSGHIPLYEVSNMFREEKIYAAK